MTAFTTESVLAVRHWTDTVFSFTATRSPSLRFDSGQFVMIGLEVEGRPLTRAYSIASASYDDYLEFLSIKVQDGPLTSRLQHIREGDKILVGRKPTGTLIVDNLKPGRVLYLLGTGTGLAPFMSLIRDPALYERFEKVVLVHGCRLVSELAYGDRIMHELPTDEYIGEAIREKLIYSPTVTREPFKVTGRITDLVVSEPFYADLGLPPLAAEHDRVMICGGPDMLRDLKAFYLAQGFSEGSLGEPGEFVIEKAFVEK
ncbi:ferredoxin--NADP reductase [Hyphomicrobium sp. CS1GBMeth3]|uniref:ferredoxin--NADP reductase n=1 Tax=Hyphomicrobium sp. CS1GBMeth3 TaxID=1892845 RepID=UPI0009304AB6|nr:ferredoxin--NADP reductase [Hyphomicrobium sp. CS1GBMeth3]